MAASFRIYQDENVENNIILSKENVLLRQNVEVKNMGQQQQQRKILSVLNTKSYSNTVTVGAGGVGEDGKAQSQKTFQVTETSNTTTAVAISKIQKTKKNQDEKDCQLLAIAAAASKKIIAPKVPVDQFKAFCVYENENLPPQRAVAKAAPTTAGIEPQYSKKCDEKNSSVADTSIANSSSHWDISLVRHPLQEITNDYAETPMSVGKIISSPMSIDKSGILQPLDESMNVSLITDTSSIVEKDVVPIKSIKDRFLDIEEYQRDIVEYLKEAEGKHLPKCGYMRKQPDINHSMRTILVDWLVEVCEEYRLHSETLCLAVSYIDRFLSIMSVVRAKLQLVGTAAMFIASKYEEVCPPDVGEFVYITDNTYTKKQVLRMEQLILKVLSFDLFVPTVHTFINIHATIHNMEDAVKFLATYFSELSLLEADPYLQYTPSHVAAASLALARVTLGKPMWSHELSEQTGYGIEELREAIIHLNTSHHAAQSLPQQAIQEKFKSSKYLSVSTLNPITLNDRAFELEAPPPSLLSSSTTGKSHDKHEDEGDDDAAEKDVNISTSSEPANENVRKMISSLIFL